MRSFICSGPAGFGVRSAGVIFLENIWSDNSFRDILSVGTSAGCGAMRKHYLSNARMEATNNKINLVIRIFWVLQ